MFVASIVKIKTINKDVLDSEWALTSYSLRLVCTTTSQQIRMCASCMTNPKSVTSPDGQKKTQIRNALLLARTT